MSERSHPDGYWPRNGLTLQSAANQPVFGPAAAIKLENCADYDERTEEAGRPVPKKWTVG
jgi:hypothetical protein